MKLGTVPMEQKNETRNKEKNKEINKEINKEKSDRRSKKISSMQDSLIKALAMFKSNIEISQLMEKTQDILGGASAFESCGGYDCFAKCIKVLEEEGRIEPVKRSDMNQRIPPLKIKWRKRKEPDLPTWTDGFFMRYSVFMDLSFYRRHKSAQTNKAANYIKKLHDFMSQRHERFEVSVEERSLELFGYEKALSHKKSLAALTLSRVKLTYEDLKMIKYGQMFVYWNRGASDPKSGIVLENHSTFFSFKRHMSSHKNIMGIDPDLIIFGNGKQILKSLQFLDEIASAEDVVLYYFGDLDPEGMDIYLNLKKTYPQMNINLMLEAYEALLKFSSQSQSCDHNFYDKTLNAFLKEFDDNDQMKSEIEVLWKRKERLAQEHISLEYLLKG